MISSAWSAAIGRMKRRRRRAAGSRSCRRRAQSRPSQPDRPSRLKPRFPTSHSDATFFNPKESFRLLPQGAGDDYTCTYSTSDADVAAVDGKTGRVTAVGPGTANITMCVDCGGTEYTFTCIVRCSW